MGLNSADPLFVRRNKTVPGSEIFEFCQTLREAWPMGILGLTEGRDRHAAEQVFFDDGHFLLVGRSAPLP